MLRVGIPERGQWPEGVLAAVAGFRQGDLVRELPLFWWGDPARPVHARTSAYAADEDPAFHEEQVIEVGQRAPYGMIATQTCDLAEEGSGKPKSAWVQLCPVFNALVPHPFKPGENLYNGGARKLIEQGKDQFRLHIPALDDGFWYADLTLEIPVERGWLAGRERIEGFVDESAREEVGKRLAWLRARPAFDSEFVNRVQTPTVEALRELNRSDREFGRNCYERMRSQIVEIGVLTSGRLAVGAAELTVLFDGSLDADLRDWWLAHWDELNGRVAGRFLLQPLQFADINTLSAAEYRKMTRLPLASISSNPAWYGADPEGFPELDTG